MNEVNILNEDMISKNSLFILILVLLFPACSSDEPDGFEDLYSKNVVIHLPQLEDESDPVFRTLLLGGMHPSYSWDGNEVIGVYAPNTPPVSFRLTGNFTSNKATFANAKEKLKKGETYYAFSPFVDSLLSHSKTAVPISYEGQRMDRFLALDDIITHLADYDFLFAKAVVPFSEDSTTHFFFTRIGSLIRIQIKLPEYGAVYKRLVLTAKEAPETVNRFVVGGNLDLTVEKKGLDGVVVNSELKNLVTQSEMILELGDIVPTEETGLTMYPALMIYPGDKRFGFYLVLEYEKDGVLRKNNYSLNGYVYKANYYYQQVAIEQSL